jgi:hypothetical protein
VVVAVAVALIVLGAVPGTPRVAHAQVTDAPAPQVLADPSKFAYGLYTAGEVGAVFPLGPLHAHLGPGFGLGLVAGYDLTRWLALEARGVGSTHTTQFPQAPQDGELLQLYQLTGAVRVSLRHRSFAASLTGDGGLLHTSTNVLATVGLNDQRTSPVYGGGLGLEYHTLSRHFALGVRGSYLQANGLGRGQLLVTTAWMRYAF